MANKNISAIVVAAGLSSRMGAVNKLLLPYRTGTIISTTVQQIIDAGAGEVIVVTGHEHEAVAAALAGMNVSIAYNKDHASGLTSSIQTGVAHAKGTGFLLCLGDMVRIEATEYRRIIDAFLQAVEQDPACICVPRYRGQKGNPVLFSVHYRQQICENKFMDGCREIVAANREHIAWIDMPSDHIVTDMDTPEDYQAILAQSK